MILFIEGNILRSLPRQWRPKVIDIQEAKNLTTLPIEELLGSLNVHEVELKEEKDFSMKGKSIALKAAKKSSSRAFKVEELLDEVEKTNKKIFDGEFSLISRKIKTMLRKKGRFKKYFAKKNSKEKMEYPEKNKMVCHECKSQETLDQNVQHLTRRNQGRA